MADTQLQATLNFKVGEAIANLKNFADESKKAFNHADEEAEQLHKRMEKLSEGFSEVGKIALGVFGGGALLGGVQGLTGGMEHLVEKGKEVAETNARMKVAFNGNTEAMEEAEKAFGELSEKYAVDDDRLKEIAATAANMGGDLGAKLSPKLTELAVGLEGLKVPGVNAEAVIRGMLKGGAEGAEGLGRLTAAFPELSGALKGITDPQEKVNKALEVMGPKLGLLRESMGGPAYEAKRFEIELDDLQKSIGTHLFNAISETALPILRAFMGGLKDVAHFFGNLPGPIQTVIGWVGKLALGIAGVIGAVTAWNVVTGLSIVARVQEAISLASSLALKTATTIATTAAAAAEWALVAATTALTSPVTLVIAGIAALAAGIWYAYNHITPFRDAVQVLWGYLKTLWGVVTGVASVVGDLGSAFLKSIPGASMAAGAIKDVGNWLGKLFETTEKGKPAQDAHTAAMDEEAKKAKELNEALQRQQALLDGLNASRKQGIDDIKKHADSMLDSLDRQREYVRTGMAEGKKLSDAQIEAYKKSNEYLIESIKKNDQDIKNYNKNLKETEKAAGRGEEETAKKAESAVSRMMKRYNAEKEGADSVFDHKKALLELELAQNPSKEREIKRAIEQAEVEHQSKLGEINTRYETEATTVKVKNDESRSKLLADFRKREDEAAVKGATSQVNITKSKLDDIQELERTHELVRENEINHSNMNEFQKRTALLEAKLNLDKIAKKRELDDGKILQETYDAAITKLDQDAAQERTKISLDAEKKRIEDKFALAKDKAEAQRKVYQKDLDMEAASYDHELETLKLSLAAKEITQEQYQLRIAAAEQKHTTERRKLLIEALQKDNEIYKGATQMVTELFKGMTASVEHALGQMFGYEKKQMESMTENDKKLSKLDHDDKVQKLRDEVQQNKMTYERYQLEKTKLDEEYNKQFNKGKEDQLSLTQTVEKAMVETVVGSLAKKGEAMVTDAITDYFLNEGKATTGFMASVMNLPFPINVALAAGGVGLIAGLFSQVPKPGGKKAGGPTEGGEDEVVDYVHGREYVLNAAARRGIGDDALHYMNRFGKVPPTPRSGWGENLRATGSPTMPVHPNLATTSAARGAMLDPKVMKDFTQSMQHIARHGIAITGESRVKDDHIALAYRRAERTVGNTAGTIGGGIR